MTDKIKHKMTRAEAITMIKRHMPDAQGHERVIDFYIEAGMLEIVEEPARPKIDWGSHLNIRTKHGVFEVIYLGIGWKGKRLVQIEENSTHDGTLPSVFAPNDDGYVVQFDSWIYNP